MRKLAETVPEDAEEHTITLRTRGDAMPNITRVLQGLRALGSIGASRDIVLDDPVDKLVRIGSFDGDGPDKIYDLKVDGELVGPMKKSAEAPKGMYKGQPADPSTVKAKTTFQEIPINLDRPKGFIMMGKDNKGNDWARRYKFDYGFIPKTLGGDGDGLDVFIGPDKNAPLAFWVVQRKDDGSFDEYKVFLGFDNRDEALAAYRAHIPKKYFNGMITMKVEMMKAMLGKVDPNEKIQRTAKLAMLDELGWLLRNN